MLVLGIIAGAVIYKLIQDNKMNKAKLTASKIIENALQEAKTSKKESLLETKEEIQKLKLDADQEIRERKFEVKKLEDRIFLKEELLSKKEETISQTQHSLDTFKKEYYPEVNGEELAREWIDLLKDYSKIGSDPNHFEYYEKNESGNIQLRFSGYERC